MIKRFWIFAVLIFAFSAVAFGETDEDTFVLEQTEEVIESEDKWLSTDELVVRCYAGDYRPGQETKPDQSDDSLRVFSQAFLSINGNIVHVSARGNEVWIVKKDQSIHRFKRGRWEKMQMPGNAVNVAASPDGWAWAVNSKDEVYRFNPDSEKWDRMPGNLIQVSALSKNEAIGTDRKRTVQLWNAQTKSWLPQPRSGPKGLGNGAIWSSLGKGDERWAIGPYNGIWRWDNKTSRWIGQPGAATTIDTHSSGRIIITNKANKGFTRIEKQKKWQILAAKVVKRATMGDDFLITLDAEGYMNVIGY